MPVSASTTQRIMVVLLCVCAFAFGVLPTEAHAVLKASAPAVNGAVAGPDVPISLTFNVRIDVARSQLRLLLPDASLIDLPLKQTAPNVLLTKATGLARGSYAIRWQVLAPDGHITRGEIPFQVTLP